jgi:hypothetical protein
MEEAGKPRLLHETSSFNDAGIGIQRVKEKHR